MLYKFRPVGDDFRQIFKSLKSDEELAAIQLFLTKHGIGRDRVGINFKVGGQEELPS